VEEHPNNRRISINIRRFTLRQLFLFVAIAGLFIAGWIQGHRSELDDQGSITLSTPGRLWLVSYGTKNGKLVYAVIVGGPHNQTLNSPVHQTQNGHNMFARLTTPDGNEISLNGNQQLFEILDGQFKASDSRITFDQLSAFIGNNRDSYDLESLLQFAKSMK
jgi:hypothetical protein